MKYDIFISYRRDGGDTLAQLIYDRLVHRGYKVFLDIESLRSGKFNEKLLEVIEQCKDVVLILPPNALERCNNADDWVYREISHSIKHQKNIVPVMMKGFVWPETLPKGLEELPNYNGIQDSKDYFDAAIDKMTSLLVSKPSAIRWGGLGNAKAKESKKYNFKEKLARRKKMIMATVVTVVLATGIGAVCYHQYLKKQEELANMVSIILFAPEEMNATEYYDAIEILEKRFEILAGENKHYFEVENDKINVNIPLEIFEEVDVETMLKCYVTRPLQLYLYHPNTDVFVPVERTAFESIELEKGRIPNLDTEAYGFDADEEYLYTKITFTEKAKEKIESVFGADEKLFRLLQDREDFPTNYYWYELIAAESGNEYYLVDVYQQENINELVKYNYSNDTFSDGFSFNVIYPVEWEKADEAATKGEYQCNVKKLSGELVTVQYAAAQFSEVTDGEFQDTIKAFKARLDALETPYAFGYTKEGEKGISIKLSMDHFGIDMMHMLGSPSVNLNISNPFTTLSIYNAETKCVPAENETYSLEFKVSESKETDLKEIIDEIESSNNREVYLKFEGLNRDCTLTKGDVSAVFRKLDEGKLIFDDLIGWGQDCIDAENKYLAAFVASCFDGDDIPDTYYVDRYRAEGSEESQFGVRSVYTEQRLKDIEESIINICPTATCNWTGTSLNIWLNLEVNDELPHKAIDAIKDIYEQCELDKGEYRVKIECASGDNESLAFIFYVSPLQQTIEYYGTYYGVQMDNYWEEFEGLVNEDIFIEQEMVPVYEQWMENWNFMIGR